MARPLTLAARISRLKRKIANSRHAVAKYRQLTDFCRRELAEEEQQLRALEHERDFPS